MKRICFVLAAIACLLSAGCSTTNDISVQTDLDTPLVNTQVNTTTVSSSVTEDEISYAVLDTANKLSVSEHDITLVPDCEINTDVSMSVVNINGVSVDIRNIALDELLFLTGTELNRFGTTYLERDTHCFVGYMYGVAGESDPTYAGMNVTIDGVTYDGGDLPTFGTTFAVEVMQNDDILILDEGIDSSEFDRYMVKGIETDLFFTENDFSIVFAGGIQVGMSREDCVSVFGDGHAVVSNQECEQIYIYNNGINTMVTIFEPDEFTGEYILDSIELINN